MERRITSKQLAGYVGVEHSKVIDAVVKVGLETHKEFGFDWEERYFLMDNLECMMVLSEMDIKVREKAFGCLLKDAEERGMEAAYRKIGGSKACDVAMSDEALIYEGWAIGTTAAYLV